MKLVSIIIPTKNRRELLRETLASVVAQTYPHWEAIVVDDGSTDGTEELVQSIAATEKRVRFLRRERKPAGASTCRNIGATNAQGEYLVFLDSDDLLAPQCLEQRVGVMERNPKVDFAVFLTGVFNNIPGDGLYLWNIFTEENDLDRFLRRDQPWHTSGPIWRKKSLPRLGLWDERALCAQDWEYHIRAIASGMNYVKIFEVDSFWRTTRPGAISNSWKSRRHVCNRVRLFKRLIAGIRSQGLLTERRRRILAGEFYESAFRMGQGGRLPYRIWIAGWRAKIVGSFEFMILLFCERALCAVWRVTHYFEDRFFPDRKVARTHAKAVLPTAHLPESAPGNSESKEEESEVG